MNYYHNIKTNFSINICIRRLFEIPSTEENTQPIAVMKLLAEKMS